MLVLHLTIYCFSYIPPDIVVIWCFLEIQRRLFQWLLLCEFSNEGSELIKRSLTFEAVTDPRKINHVSEMFHE